MIQVTDGTLSGQSESPETACQEVVRLFRRGQLLEIIPPVAGLAEAFETVIHQGRSSRANGFEILPQRYPLVWTQSESAEFRSPKDYMQTFAGLEEDICEFVRQTGRKIELTGHRPLKLDKPKWSVSGGKTGDRRLLRLVQHHERGLVRYRPQSVDVAWCIAQIALAWPEERIVVVATRQHDAEYLAGSVRRFTSEVSLATAEHYPARAKRIAVVTQNHLRQVGVQAESRTILISVNPTELLYGKEETLLPGDWLPKMRCRLYGLLPETAAVAPSANDLLMALFGSQEIHIPRHGFHDLPVRVVSLPYNQGQKSPSKLSDTGDVHAVKRDQVWKNGLRNRWIAGLARAVIEEDCQALAKKYAPWPRRCCRKSVSVSASWWKTSTTRHDCSGD